MIQSLRKWFDLVRHARHKSQYSFPALTYDKRFLMSIKITADQLPSPRQQGWGLIRLEQGPCPPQKPHRHPFDEFVLMLSGRCIMENDGRRTEYRAGDIGLFPRNQAHRCVEAFEDSVYLWTRGDDPES